MDPKRLAAILKECGDAEIEFREDGDNVVLKAGKDRWTLPTMKVGEFPQPRTAAPDSIEVTMRGGSFRQIFKRSSFVADDRAYEK